MPIIIWCVSTLECIQFCCFSMSVPSLMEKKNECVRGIESVSIMLCTASENSCRWERMWRSHRVYETLWSALAQPSASFNSWLWLKFHDSVLVVAEGTLIDRREIYCALASCRLKKRGDQGEVTADLWLKFGTAYNPVHKPKGFHLLCHYVGFFFF